MFWFEKQSYRDFHAELLAEVVAKNDDENIKWVNTSYNNDTTGSIGVNVCIDTETFVQLFAFETDEDAKVEGLDRYMVYVSVDAEESYTGFFPDRDEAIKDAIARAKQLNAEYVPTIEDEGFEHEGVWVTDRTKSPCGRFDLTPEQSREMYGDK